MAEVVYCNIGDNHFKVWGYDFFSSKNGESEVITYWGRIGSMMHKLQKKRKEFSNRSDAFDFVSAKLKEKRAKGYFEVPNHLYFGAIIEGSLSKLAKILEKHQVKG